MQTVEPDTFFIVDVFTNAPYRGNQLAVVFGARDDDEMLAVTREMNYSETTFVDGQNVDGTVPVRIFTPGGEVPFAGHPTLGTAFVLREFLGFAEEPIRLREAAGIIPVRVENGRYWMSQRPAMFGRAHDPAVMAERLSLTVADIDTRYPIQEVSTGLPALIVPLRSLAAARRAWIRPPHGADDPLPAVLVFTPEVDQTGYDYHVRVFVGALGIPEDAATGSANGCLAAYLIQHVASTSQIEATVEQGLEMGRPSTIFLRARRLSAGTVAVDVGGDVTPVARGRLVAPR